VKKIVIRFILVLAMIMAIFLTPAVHAADTTKIPYDYLYPEEQTFVTQVRAYILIARTRLDTAQTDLDTAALQDLSEWRPGMMAELDALNSSLADLSGMDPPDNFISIGNQLKSLGRINVAYFGAMVVISADFIEFAQILASMNASLKRAGTALDNLSQSLEKKVKDLAKQREANEKAAEAFISSCLSEPGPP
jgi:hypothetical protein